MELNIEQRDDDRESLAQRHDDAWAYTPEHLALLKRGHADAKAGRVRQLSERELMALVPDEGRDTGAADDGT